MRFYGTYGVCGGCVASVIRSGIHDAINKCSYKCFLIFYDYTKVHDFLCDGVGIVQTRNPMFQWRFDNYGAISLLYFLLERCES